MLRAFGALASSGLQLAKPADAPASAQWTRTTSVFFDDFEEGLYVTCV